MSNAIFPTLPGLAFDVGKSPLFSTAIQRAASGRELRRRRWAHPLYQIALTFEFLRDDVAFNELKTLAGFYMQRGGSFDSFLFTDPDDNRAINEVLAVGDSVATAFQAQRTFGGNVEPLSNVASIDDPNGASMWGADPATAPMWSADTANTSMWAAVIYKPSDYTLNPGGQVVFNRPVPAGVTLLWSGSFYYRCRFNDDQMDFNKFMDQLWNLKTCDLLATLGDKL